MTLAWHPNHNFLTTLLISPPDPVPRCEWGQWGVLRHSIILHHYGKVYNGNEPRSNPCNVLKGWGDDCDAMLGQFRRILGEGMEKGYEPCHFLGECMPLRVYVWVQNKKEQLVRELVFEIEYAQLNKDAVLQCS